MKVKVTSANPAGFGQVFTPTPLEYRSPGAALATLLAAAVANLCILVRFLPGGGALEFFAAGTANAFDGIFDSVNTEVATIVGERLPTTRTAYDWTITEGAAFGTPLPVPTGPLSLPALLDLLSTSEEDFNMVIDQIAGTIKVIREISPSNPDTLPAPVVSFALTESNTWE